MRIKNYYYYYFLIKRFFCWWYQMFLHCKLTTDSTLSQLTVHSHNWQYTPTTDSTLPQLTVHSHNSIRSCCVANLILTKLKSSPLQGKLIQLIIFTNCMINAQLIPTPSKIWEFFRYCILYWSLKMLPLNHALTYCLCTVDCCYYILYYLALN